MSGATTVRTTIDASGLARLTFDQPDSRANVLSRRAWDDLAAALAALAGRPLRGVVLDSAKPNIFLAGADLREIADLPIDDPEPTRELVRRGLAVLATLESLPVPTVAVIDGACLGGGLEVALACDYRVVTDNPKTRLGLPEVKLALIPGWGGTQRLPRVIDSNVALAMICRGETLDAEQARAVGLADVVDLAALPDDWPARRARKQAPGVAPEGTLALALPQDELTAAEVAADVLMRGIERHLLEGLAVEMAAFVERVASPEARAKIASFLRR